MRIDHITHIAGLGGTVYVGTGAGVFGYSPLVEAIALVNDHKDYWIQVCFSLLPTVSCLRPTSCHHSTRISCCTEATDAPDPCPSSFTAHPTSYIHPSIHPIAGNVRGG